jgi:hypothetical protein
MACAERRDRAARQGIELGDGRSEVTVVETQISRGSGKCAPYPGECPAASSLALAEAATFALERTWRRHWRGLR